MDTKPEADELTGNWYVDVAVDTPVPDRHRLLTYALPPHLIHRVQDRQLVWVPLRKNLKLGVVTRIHQQAPSFAVRPVHAPVEPEFCLSQDAWSIVEWMSEETLCSVFEAASLFLPPGVTQRSVEHLRLREGADLNGLALTKVQRELVDLLAQQGEISVEAARRALNRPLTSVIDTLARSGVIEQTARVRNRQTRNPTTRYVRLLSNGDIDLSRAPAQRRAYEVLRRRSALSGGAPLPWDDLVSRSGVTPQALRALQERQAVEITEAPAPPRATLAHEPPRGSVQLTSEQASAWRQILGALRERQPAEFLLHGVTGSGKTEIYLRAAAWCLSRGLKVIALVPEIALASQVVARFTERFPGQVAVLHSALPEGDRYHTWKEVAAGRLPVVVGPRSALFAPLKQVGLILVDEEHEAAYKQDNAPRYHTREVARRLSQIHGATLVLGSATPDITTYFDAVSGKSELLTLSTRVGPPALEQRTQGHQPLAMPEIDIVDMRLELQQGNTGIFSRALQDGLQHALDSGEQAILFLNRRGMSTVVQCRSCGHVETCPYCDIPFVYHADREQLVCHRCNHRQNRPARCPECASQTISYYGTGTQRVERAVRERYPNARVMRWDHDALRRGVTHDTLFKRVIRHEVDLIVGTQMVAKGLDFPLVSTIGVINADTLLHLPDFRSGERTFQLLTQVAGRAGRRTAGSRVIVQTYSTHHYAIQAASRHDYDTFYRDEIAFRREHGYPPWRRLVRLSYRHRDEAACEATAAEVADMLARTAYQLQLDDIELLGPTPSFAARVREFYGWQIILRGSDAQRLAASVPLDPGWIIDVDPISLL